MYSRIETLLGMLNLENREANHVKNTENVFDLDYKQLISTLNLVRKSCIDLLDGGLTIS